MHLGEQLIQHVKLNSAHNILFFNNNNNKINPLNFTYL